MSTGRFSSANELCQKAKAAGYKWLALEWNDFGNSSRSSAVKQACINNNLIYTIWMTRNFTAAEARQAVVESGASGFLAEAEIPPENSPGVPNPQEQNWPELIFELSDINIFKGIVTNFAPFVYAGGLPWPEKAAPLINDGWHCLTECYLSESPNSTPERTDFYAKVNLGWPETQPVLGLYGGKTFADYPTRNNYRNWSVWSANSVL